MIGKLTPYVMVESLGWFYALPMMGKTVLPALYKHLTDWVRHHDRYESGKLLDADRPYWPKVDSADTSAGSSSCCGSENNR